MSGGGSSFQVDFRTCSQTSVWRRQRQFLNEDIKFIHFSLFPFFLSSDAPVEPFPCWSDQMEVYDPVQIQDCEKVTSKSLHRACSSLGFEGHKRRLTHDEIGESIPRENVLTVHIRERKDHLRSRAPPLYCAQAWYSPFESGAVFPLRAKMWPFLRSKCWSITHMILSMTGSGLGCVPRAFSIRNTAACFFQYNCKNTLKINFIFSNWINKNTLLFWIIDAILSTSFQYQTRFFIEFQSKSFPFIFLKQKRGVINRHILRNCAPTTLFLSLSFLLSLSLSLTLTLL